MGIQLLSAPLGVGNEAPGPMNLPMAFDRKKSAAKWVKQGPAVDAAKEREWIAGTQLTADGWNVWKDGDGKPHTVSLQSGVYVLLHRSRAVQDAVNAICGNIGKERLKQERSGVTTGGVPVQDPGLLSDDRIAKVTGVRENLEEGDVEMNPVPDVERQRVESPKLKTVASRSSPRRSAT
jgi:hypothetical protein